LEEENICTHLASLTVKSSSHPQLISIAPLDDSSELLDEFSLKIVLDMSAVMTTAEELTQLESLTPAQKRQVWMATPEEVKLRLKKIRAEALAEASTSALSAPKEDELERLEAIELGERLEEEILEEEILEEEILEEFPEEEIPEEEILEEEQAEEASLEEMGEAIDYVASEDSLFSLPLFQNSHDLNEPSIAPEIGDLVVLRAEPRLTTEELIAVWEIVAIQGEQARLEAKGLGSRQYPLSWMVLYPEVEF
jgi:hypothetical protein